MMLVRRNFVFVISAALTVGAIGCQRESSPVRDARMEPASYALGRNIGQNLKRQAFGYDLKSLYAGLSDALTDAPSKLTDAEMKTAMITYQNSAVDQVKAKAEKNRLEGESFLVSNQKRTDWHTTRSGLQYKVLKAGAGNSPKDTDVVRISYVGTTIHQEPIDGAATSLPIETGLGKTLPGMQEALKMIRPGGEIQVVLPPNLAYGQQGHASLGPNATVLFDISLLDVKSVGKTSKVTQ